MPKPDHIEARNRDYQQRLAASLIGTIGVEGALQTSLAHGWEGVLENVLRHTDRGDRPGGFAIPQRPVGQLTP